MRKLSLLFILFIFSLALWAQEEEAPNDGSSPGILSWDDLDREPPPKKRFALKNRRFEFSLVDLDISFSNSFLAADYVIRNPVEMIKSGKLFKDSVSINVNDFLDGFQINADVIVNPVSFKFNWKDKWGFGMDIGRVDVTGNLLLSGHLMSINEADSDKFGAGGAVFVDCGIPVFFHYDDFKIKIRPSVYLPVVYAEPNITYSYTESFNPSTGDPGMRMQVDYDVRVYSIVDMQGFGNGDMGAVWRNLQDKGWDIPRNNLGYDFSLGVEYPWYDWLDVGVDIVNIPVPFASANLDYYMQFNGQAFFDSSRIDIGSMIDGEDLSEDAYGYPEDMEIKYFDNGGKTIYRPFTMLFYAKYRPNESQIFSLIPSLGFSINRLYTKIGSVEGGLSARWDLWNIFITTVGINYNDRRWRNSFDFVFNLRVFEFDLGISFQSSNFKKSFQGAGLGVAIGLKFGW